MKLKSKNPGRTNLETIGLKSKNAEDEKNKICDNKVLKVYDDENSNRMGVSHGVQMCIVYM